jgi:hypothetical protein
VSVGEAAAIGFPAGRREGLFPSPVRRFAHQPSPEFVRIRAQVASLAVYPLQSSFVSNRRVRLLANTPPARVSVLSRHHHRASTHAVSQLRCSVLRRSQPLDGFLRPMARRSFSPCSRDPGLCPFKGLSSSHSYPPSSGGDAPLPLDRPRSPTSGLPQDQSSTSRPCSMRGRQYAGSVVSLPGDRSPLRVFSAPPGAPPAVGPKKNQDQTSMVLAQHLFRGPRSYCWGVQPTFDAFTAGSLLPCLHDSDLPELCEPPARPIVRGQWSYQRLRVPSAPLARRPTTPPGPNNSPSPFSAASPKTDDSSRAEPQPKSLQRR